MDLEFDIKLEPGNAAQIFLENGRFDSELMFVARVLVVATAAALKVRTARRDAFCRGSENLFGSGPRKARLLFDNNRIDGLALQNERHESGFASPPFIRGQASQTVAAVDQLLNGEFQALILQTARVGRTLLSAAVGVEVEVEVEVEVGVEVGLALVSATIPQVKGGGQECPPHTGAYPHGRLHVEQTQPR